MRAEPLEIKRKSLFEYDDYKQYLIDEFYRRLDRNDCYSLRAFSRDLGLRPAALSDIMNGRYGLSAASARKVASRLRFDDRKALFFVALVECRHSRSVVMKEAALRRIRMFCASRPEEEVSPARLSEGRRDAVRASREVLTTVIGFRPDRPEECKAELEKMNRELVDKFSSPQRTDGVYVAVVQLFRVTASEGASSASDG